MEPFDWAHPRASRHAVRGLDHDLGADRLEVSGRSAQTHPDKVIAARRLSALRLSKEVLLVVAKPRSTTRETVLRSALML